jgi:hypothetical protein
VAQGLPEEVAIFELVTEEIFEVLKGFVAIWRHGFIVQIEIWERAEERQENSLLISETEGRGGVREQRQGSGAGAGMAIRFREADIVNPGSFGDGE